MSRSRRFPCAFKMILLYHVQGRGATMTKEELALQVKAENRGLGQAVGHLKHAKAQPAYAQGFLEHGGYLL